MRRGRTERGGNGGYRIDDDQVIGKEAPKVLLSS